MSARRQMLPDSYVALADLLTGRRIVALTGAGCSTESGIPAYRQPDGALRVRAPIRYRQFAGDAAARRRYWARSVIGWPRMAGARPNPAHLALARLETAGRVAGIITQNVDGLHGTAGSGRVVELHGRLDRVLCLGCGAAESRAGLQRRLAALNPGWRGVEAAATPDGDAALAPGAEAGFRVADCRRCGGVLKPDVVFFGESVPRSRVERASSLLGEGEALLVVGSSLAVWSGYRFVLRAAETGLPVAIVNLGVTRGDALARVRLRGTAGAVLPLLADDLLRPHGNPTPDTPAMPLSGGDAAARALDAGSRS